MATVSATLKLGMASAVNKKKQRHKQKGKGQSIYLEFVYDIIIHYKTTVCFSLC